MFGTIAYSQPVKVSNLKLLVTVSHPTKNRQHMNVSELNDVQLEEYETRAMNQIAPCDFPNEGDTIDIVCSFGTVTATKDEWDTMLCSWNFQIN